MESEHQMSPTALLLQMGVTPADYGEGFQTALPWKSKMAGRDVKNLFHYQEMLGQVAANPLLGPLAFMAGWQKEMLDHYILAPIKAQAREAARTGRNPDLFTETNAKIYGEYAKLLHELTGHFIQEGRFDQRKAREVTSTPAGESFLKEYIEAFAKLEYAYNSIGLTKLKAMKNLLKALLILITERPLDGEDLPFIKKNKDGTDGMTFAEYAEDNRIRFENLYRENAFDILAFSERATGGKIGYSPYRIVRGSKMHTVTLRHYALPKGILPNGKILYLSTPLINRPELFDLDQGKSVVEGLLKEGYEIYLVDFGDPGPEEAHLGLAYYGQTIPNHYFDLIKKRHPGQDIYVIGYCMGGTLMLPYLARRAEERLARGEEMDIKKIALLTTPVRFDDGDSGQGPMRAFIISNYDRVVMRELFGDVNVPPQVIQFGMNEIQPGVQYTLSLGFYGRASFPGAIPDAAPFLYWLTHGTKFPARAHREWLDLFFLGNQLIEGTYCLPSSNPDLDGKPVNLGILKEAGVRIFDYRGTRDPIAPPGSCVASERWGQGEDGNLSVTRGGLNRTIEKNIGHIFVVSKQLLAEFLQIVGEFLRD